MAMTEIKTLTAIHTSRLDMNHPRGLAGSSHVFSLGAEESCTGIKSIRTGTVIGPLPNCTCPGDRSVSVVYGLTLAFQ